MNPLTYHLITKSSTHTNNSIFFLPLKIVNLTRQFCQEDLKLDSNIYTDEGECKSCNAKLSEHNLNLCRLREHFKTKTHLSKTMVILITNECLLEIDILKGR